MKKAAKKALPRIGLVVVAGGSGQRFGAPKQFESLHGWPLLAWCLFAFEQMNEITERVVVLPRGSESEPPWCSIVPALSKVVVTATGGETRATSVLAGVEALSGKCDLVAIHDGARPFPPLKATREAIVMLRESTDFDAAIVARRPTETIKRIGVEEAIDKTLDRGRIALAETPQVCRREALLQALVTSRGRKATDEAHAIESAGGKTALVFHHGWNPKVTLPQDLALASAWLATGEAVSFRAPKPPRKSRS